MGERGGKATLEIENIFRVKNCANLEKLVPGSPPPQS